MNGSDGLAKQREQMVIRQIARRGVKNPAVLAAMRRVPRERFVPDHLQGSAYADCALPITEGQTISQPYIVALMTEALELQGGERVLEIGTGSGYQAAVLAEITAAVYSVERRDTLSETAGAVLSELGYEHVRLRRGDGTLGWPEEAPFDAIIITAAAPEVPQPLIDQLAEGGRLVAPVGAAGYQNLVRLRKEKGVISTEHLIPVAFVPLIGEHGWDDKDTKDWRAGFWR